PIGKYFLTLTKECNLRCIYCHQGQEKENESIFVDAKKVAGYFPDNGKYEVVLFGGEPLYYWDYFQNIVYALKERNPQTTLAVTTNGTLLTPDRVKFLNDLEIRASISHDGALFEKTRGAADFLKTNPDLYLALKYRSIGATSCTLNWNYYDIWDYFEEFKIRHGLPEREVVYIQNTKDVDDNTSDKLLIYDSPKWEEMLDKVFFNLTNQLRNSDFSGYEWMQYGIWVKSVGDRLRQPERMGCGCGADTHAAHLDIFGNLYACHNMSDPNSHVKNGLQTGNWNPYIKTEKCQKCPAFITCGGGCLAAHPNKHKYICYIRYHQGVRLLNMLHQLNKETLNNEINLP
ncbi:MAG: radical SAM protein, partial [Sporomusaceae bacterium]|nr:radical SAM protein [Sporomusaceae bacterium]